MRLIFALLVCSCLGAGPAQQVPPTAMAFEPNVGQADGEVKFLAHAPHGMLWLTEEGAVLGIGVDARSVVRLRFEGGKASRIESEEPRAGISNYFIGNDRRNWHTGVPQYGKVRYRAVYPGIDVVFYGNPSNLEYDFVLSPGADPSRIQLAFDGVSKVSADADGGLLLTTGSAKIRNLPPLITQDGKSIGGHWAIHGKNHAGFIVDRFDRARPLVIDPVLTYATVLGGANEDTAQGVALDSQGNIIVVGQTASPTFPLKSALSSTFQDLSGSTSYGFVSKINPSASNGASLLYSTFFASGGADGGSDINAVALDRNGNVYFTGRAADNLPLQNFLMGQGGYVSNANCLAQSQFNYCYHAFVAEISANGTALLFSSYLGGSSNDQGLGIAVDQAGNIYVAGTTQSHDFPTTQFAADNSLSGTRSGFVSVISSKLALSYSTYFGSGGSGDQVSAIAVDSRGLVYIAGIAGGTGLPTANGFQSSYPGGRGLPSCGFAAILDPVVQTSLVYSTYLGGVGGNAATFARAVGTDGSGNIYVAGVTSSSTFPVTSSAFRTPKGGSGVFVAKLNPSLQGQQQLAYSTMLSGPQGDIADSTRGLAVDSSGRVTVVGQTYANDYPVTANAYQPAFSIYSGFISVIDPSQSGAASLVYSSFVGDPVDSVINAVAVDPTGRFIVVAGESIGANSPVVTPSGFQTASPGNGDAYIARFDMSQTGPLLTAVENGASLSADKSGTISPGMIVTLKGTGLGPTAGANGTIDPNSGKVSSSAAGVQVLINGTPCPLLYLSATQINAIAPYELATLMPKALVQVQVIYNQVAGNVLYLQVAATNPGIFSFDDGAGQGAILNQDHSVNGPTNAAARGSQIQIFATGEGQTVPPGVDGAIANEPVASIPTPAATLSLMIGGVPVPAASIAYAGTLPQGVAGALQINATIPTTVMPGPAVPVVLTIGSASSPSTLTMAVQ